MVLLGYRPIVARSSSGPALRYSTDDGQTWSELVLADTGGGYTSSVELQDGSILVVYYTDQGIGPPRDAGGPASAQALRRHSNIRAKRFRVTEAGIEWMKVAD